MSTPTEHLGLHQWEAGDSFLRTDFNEDFAKIDAGVAVAHALAEGYCVTGSYTVTDRKAFDIELGFRPRLVIVITSSSYKLLAALMDGEGVYLVRYSSSSAPAIGQFYQYAFTDTGIHIDATCELNNYKDDKYYYAAFR